MSKARSDSVLDGLPRNQREALEEWLFEENLSYQDAKKRLWQDFNVSTSRSGLERFYARVNQRRLLQRIMDSSQTAAAVKEKFDESKAPIESALKKMLAQLAFEMSVSGKAVDPETFVAISGLVLKAQEQELKKQAIELQRDRFEFDAAEACLKKLPELKSIAANGSLDQHAKLRAIREKLFGEVPDSEPEGPK
jgi:hypothetical protein